MPVVIPNTYGTTPPAPPAREDGELYRFEMIYRHLELRAYADEARELLALLIPGYPELEPAARRTREQHALAVQLQFQPVLTLQHPELLTDLTAAEWEVLNSDRSTQPAIERWDAQVPLLLIATGYEPYTSTPKPVDGKAGGKQMILWLRPVEEESYLISLGESGWLFLAHLKE
ncbi:MAG: hypothetical protein ACYDGN_09215 [Acidimicrobiales bacterium]